MITRKPPQLIQLSVCARLRSLAPFSSSVFTDGHDHDLVRRELWGQNKPLIVAMHHDDRADQSSGKAPRSCPAMLQRAALVEIANFEGFREILAQIVRGSGLAKPFRPPSSLRWNNVWSAPANRSDADLRPGITGIAASSSRNPCRYRAFAAFRIRLLQTWRAPCGPPARKIPECAEKVLCATPIAPRCSIG